MNKFLQVFPIWVKTARLRILQQRSRMGITFPMFYKWNSIWHKTWAIVWNPETETRLKWLLGCMNVLSASQCIMLSQLTAVLPIEDDTRMIQKVSSSSSSSCRLLCGEQKAEETNFDLSSSWFFQRAFRYIGSANLSKLLTDSRKLQFIVRIALGPYCRPSSFEYKVVILLDRLSGPS